MIDENSKKIRQRHWTKFIQFDDSLALPNPDGSDPKENKNPMIPIEQFRNQLRNVRKSLNLSEKQIQVLADAADENKDGYISLEEFQRLITSRDAQESNVKRILYSLADPLITPKQSIAVHTQIDDDHTCHFPFFILTVTTLQIAVFIIYYNIMDEEVCSSLTSCCPGCASLSDPEEYGPWMFVPTLRYQLWRYFTSGFMHAGITHLAGNMIAQLVVGVSLEVVHGSWRIALLYYLADIGGCMLAFAIDPSEASVGASAAVYALITAHLANVFLNWSEMPRKWLRLILSAGYAINDFAGGFSKMSNCQRDGVSIGGHLGGAIVGLLVGIILLYNIKVKRYEIIVRKICIVVACIYFFVLLILNIVRTAGTKSAFLRLFHCIDDLEESAGNSTAEYDEDD